MALIFIAKIDQYKLRTTKFFFFYSFCQSKFQNQKTEKSSSPFVGFPGGWLSGKEPACSCRRLRFDPWARKIPCKRKHQPSPVFLPGKSHGQRSLEAYSPWGRKRVGHYLAAKQQQTLSWSLSMESFLDALESRPTLWFLAQIKLPLGRDPQI